MALVIPPGFGNAAFIFSSDVGTPEFVTTIGVDLSGFGGDFVLAANSIMIQFATAFEDELGAEITLNRVNLAVGQDGPGGSVDSDIPAIPMTRSGTQVPVAMSAIARKVTNDLGRRGRGRMFLPHSLVTSEVDESGNISSGRVTTLQAALDAFYDGLVDNPIDPAFSAPPVLLHGSAPVDPTPITGLTVAPLVGWIRGRIR